jgi:hypothetical protein
MRSAFSRVANPVRHRRCDDDEVEEEMMETRRTERHDEWKRTRGGDAKRRQ